MVVEIPSFTRFFYIPVGCLEFLNHQQHLKSLFFSGATICWEATAPTIITPEHKRDSRNIFPILPPCPRKKKRAFSEKNINLIQFFAKKGRLKQPPSTINPHFPHRGFGTAKSWVQASMSSMRFRRCGDCGVFYVEKSWEVCFWERTFDYWKMLGDVTVVRIITPVFLQMLLLFFD